jgi:alanyl-tRNA synthetase
MFKITSESAIAAGVRRVEAITGYETEKYVEDQETLLKELKEVFKNQKDLIKAAQSLIEQNIELKKQVETLNREKAKNVGADLKNQIEVIDGINFISGKLDLDMGGLRDLAFQLNREMENVCIILGSENNGKANLVLMISENLTSEKKMHAGNMIREIAKQINGGGGGQPHFATAGGKNPDGFQSAFEMAKKMVRDLS